jgi:hypothetical protein
MPFKFISLTVATLATTAAGYAALTIVAPEAGAKIESLVRDRGLGWDAAACEANPAGCLTSRYNKLQALERDVDVSVQAIRSELQRVSSMVDEQEMLAGKNGVFLEQGRSIFRERSVTPDAAISFAGRTYPSMQTFRAQLQLLFEERAALETSLATARELRKTLQERLDTLMVQSGQINLAKRVVPAQLQLVRANRTLSDFKTNVAMIDGVIYGSEAGLGQSQQLIRTTRDMIGPATSSSRGSTVSKEAFDSFLKN